MSSKSEAKAREISKKFDLDVFETITLAVALGEQEKEIFKALNEAIGKQEKLGKDFQKVLYDNLWELYES